MNPNQIKPDTINQIKRMPSRQQTSQQNAGGDRPMTSMRAVGYDRNIGKEKEMRGTKAQFMLTKTNTTSKEQIIKELEKSIQKLYDESIILKAKGDLQNAKDKCSQAYEKFFDFKSKNQDYFNIELEFGMKLNLGLIYQGLNQLEEAKQVYQDILKNETYYSPGIQHNRIRVNLGNIYFQIASSKSDIKEKHQNFKNAITEYRKAVDKINKENKELKSNIMKNIALCHIKLGNYPDAIEVYTDALKLNPDIRTALNLLLCHLAVGEIEQTKNVFNIMLEVSSIGDAELQDVNENKQDMDALKEYLLVRKKDNHQLIVNIALIITHYIEKDPLAAFDYIIEIIKKNKLKETLNEIEMAKAMHFLKKRDVEKTINIMKSFENKDKRLIARVSTNISFLYFIEGDITNAEKYANIALENERYNHKALVNKGNIHFAKDDFSKAREYYLEAIGVQSDCIEAIYNLGMVNIKMDCLYDAIQAFEKLNSVVPNIPEVLYKIAKLHEEIRDYDNTIKYFSLLLAQIPNDPILLYNIGLFYYKLSPKEEKTALQYFIDSQKYFPANHEILILLGFLFFKDEIYEKAINYFELACKVQPDNISGELQYAKCFFKLGSYREALRVYKRIHSKHPDNREALTLLIAVCKELGLPYDEFTIKLSRLEREQVNYGNQGGEMGGYYPNNVSGSNYENKYYEGENVDLGNYPPQKHSQNKNPNQNKYNPDDERTDDLLPD